MPIELKQALEEFARFGLSLQGDEKSEAQTDNNCVEVIRRINPNSEGADFKNGFEMRLAVCSRARKMCP